MPTIEGGLQIGLTRRGGRVSEVMIHSSRPLQAPQLFHGKTVEQMLATLPLLYHICGIAQASAAVTASEQALGLAADPATAQAREMLVWMETAREHLWRIMLDWAQWLALPRQAPAVTQVQQWLAEFRQALFAGGEAFRPGATVVLQAEQVGTIIAQLSTLLEEEVFGCSLQQWLALEELGSLRGWMDNRQTVAARMLAEIAKQPDCTGRQWVDFLPSMDASELHRRFTQDDAETFVAKPVWQGMAHETTALARQGRHPLISDMFVVRGDGVMTRLVARLLELASIPARLRCLLAQVAASQAGDVRGKATPQADGLGLAQVEAARGRLIHRLELGQGVIRRYQILAPTEWNFHPQGVAAQLLQALPAEDEARLRRQADLLINAIDPCVRYEMTVHNA